MSVSGNHDLERVAGNKLSDVIGDLVFFNFQILINIIKKNHVTQKF